MRKNAFIPISLLLLLIYLFSSCASNKQISRYKASSKTENSGKLAINKTRKTIVKDAKNLLGTKYKYGSMHWRYTIPGHGVSDWIQILKILNDNGYDGCISIELEDHFFDDTEADQKLGVLQGAKFLTGC